MKTENLVNGYVLPNLFYELIFLDEYEVTGSDEDWANPKFVDGIIIKFIVSRFKSSTSETQQVIHNTLCYLLATEPDSSEIWDVIWQASSAPIPTPNGIRSFMKRCYDILFAGELLPSSEEVKKFNINHSMQIANRLH